MAYFGAMMALKANEKIVEKPVNIEFYKIKTAEFYFYRIFPRIEGLTKTMMKDPKSLMQMDKYQF